MALTKIFPGIVFTATLLGAQFAPQPVQAKVGCCMERQASGGWAEITRNFEDCLERNERLDRGDDIFEPMGRIWWNLDC